MPEPATDRCAKSHEYIFLLSRSERYAFDHRAIKEEVAPSQIGRVRDDVVDGASWKERGQHSAGGKYRKLSTWEERKANGEPIRRGDPAQSGHVTHTATLASEDGRNKRSVWEINTMPFPDAHFATFPPALIEPCILAGCPEGGTVLDPFGGAGTTGLVADRLKRNAILIELNPAYAAMAERRIRHDAGMFAEIDH